MSGSNDAQRNKHALPQSPYVRGFLIYSLGVYLIWNSFLAKVFQKPVDRLKRSDLDDRMN